MLEIPRLVHIRCPASHPRIRNWKDCSMFLILPFGATRSRKKATLPTPVCVRTRVCTYVYECVCVLWGKCVVWECGWWGRMHPQPKKVWVGDCFYNIPENSCMRVDSFSHQQRVSGNKIKFCCPMNHVRAPSMYNYVQSLKSIITRILRLLLQLLRLILVFNTWSGVSYEHKTPNACSTQGTTQSRDVCTSCRACCVLSVGRNMFSGVYNRRTELAKPNHQV